MQNYDFSDVGWAAWRWFIADDDEKEIRYAEFLQRLILLEKQMPDACHCRHLGVFLC